MGRNSVHSDANKGKIPAYPFQSPWLVVSLCTDRETAGF